MKQKYFKNMLWGRFLCFHVQDVCKKYFPLAVFFFPESVEKIKFYKVLFWIKRGIQYRIH